MKSLKFAAWALLAMLASEIPAQAAWNNVFQPTLFGRLNRSSTSAYCCPAPAPVFVAQAAPIATPTCSSCGPQPTTSFSAPACPSCVPAPVCAPACPPPVQQCTTNYVQRSYYQPVTTYESRSFYEPVTTMQTSFYYEPVTTMQTSYYFDPCSCAVKCKSTPVTSYSLRQQSCPVQSWVQRCAQVPVTSYKQMFYMEPQTTCCNTAPAVPAPVAAAPAPCCGQQPQQPQTQSPAPSYSPPPVIDQPKQAPSGPTGSASYYSPHQMSSNTNTGSNWQPSVVKLGTPRAEDTVQGQVTRNDRTPKQAEVLFVNAVTGARHTVTTNEAGRFQTALTSGDYHVFLTTGSGSAAYHSLVNVDSTRNTTVNIVN